MTLGRRSIVLFLVLLFIGAAWVRLDRLGGVDYPYYNGESGTNFRHAQMIADDGRLPLVDTRASHPEGYDPSRVKPTGVEYFTGYALRFVRPFTDFSDKRLAGILTLLVFSASVFTLYALTRRIWDCQAAGGFAAILVAFSGPRIDATCGREYLHAPYAFFVISLHLAFFAGFVARPSPGRAALTALAAFTLLGLWSSAGVYIAVFALAALTLPKLAPAVRRWTLVSHLAAAFIAGVLLPHLRAEHFVLTWPVAWLLVGAVYSSYRDAIPPRFPRWVLVPAAFAALAFLMGILRGTTGDVLDPLVYWLYRLRYIGGRPDDPTALPDMVRIAWTSDRLPPSAGTLLAFFLPLVFVIFPAVAVFRRVTRERGVAPWLFVAAAGLGTAVFVLDGGALFSAALLAFPFVSGAFRGFGANLKTRAAAALLALASLAAASPLVPASADFLRSIDTRSKLASKTPRSFVWASIGNADRELVRFLVTRTSTRKDVILAPPAISSLIVTFAGRTTVVAPGVYTKAMTAKTVRLYSSFYGDEERLVEECRFLGVTHVVYSIDVLLDDSGCSPRYISATEGDIEKTLAYRMHFDPEALEHFQLVYENDNYRIFRLTERTEPVFLTDHPPVYQEEILRTAGGDLGTFHFRIIDILATYHTAADAQTRGDEEEAIRRFEYCLGHAPFFTAARLGMADSLLRLRRLAQTSEAYRYVLRYAPDNTHALYYGALSLAYSGSRDEALELVELLLNATADREILSQALELKTALVSGRAVSPPDSPSADETD